MNGQVRSLEIAEPLLNACDTGAVVRSFKKAERENPDRLSELRGTTLIMFPCLDQDPRPNYLIPEVRSFIQKLYKELPHFFYYLHPEPALGAVGMHTLCLLPLSELSIEGDRAMPKSYATLAEVMRARLKPAAEFASQIGDDPEQLVLSFRSCIPDEHWPSVYSELVG